MKISTTALILGEGVPLCPMNGNPCSGEACAAWRWLRAKETDAFLADVRAEMRGGKVDFVRASSKVYAEKGGTYDKVEGYCGVGGKPE